MSDSEQHVPSEASISQKLRDVVISIYTSGKDEDLTIKRVRVRAEKELSLPDGYLKKDAWKQKSQDAITAAVDRYCNAREPTPTKAATPEPSPKPAKKIKAKSETSKGVKRKAAAPAKKAKKRRKTDSDDDVDEELSDPLSDVPSVADSEPPKKLVRRGKRTVAEDSEEEATPKKPTKKAKKPVVDDDSEDEAATPVENSAATPPPARNGNVSESEMSSLIDESPKKKSRQNKEPVTKAKKGAKPAASKPKAAKPKTEDNPDTTEIKRLQGWLVKCGVRKVWSRDPELSKCDTNKEKISVLKGMLKDVGMDGKYSVEKAAKIKEKREFEKDLAAIQEAEAHWGTAGDNAGGRPRRRAAAAAAVKPQQKIEFSDDDENEDGDEAEHKEPSDDDDDDDAEDDSIQGGSADNDDDQDDSSAADSE